jgi:hypothetical protein
MNTTGNLKILLTAVIFLQFGFPITTYGRPWIGVYILSHVAMVLFGTLTVRSERQPLPPVMVLAVAVLAFGAWFSLDPASRAATMGINVATGLFMLNLIVFLLRFIFEEDRASGPSLVLAAVCVYLLLGGVFKSVFVATELLQPGSFVDSILPGEPVAWQQLLYYSYVTLANLGYGDVLPVTLWARSFASLEAVIGPLFLATIVVRLVGAYAAMPWKLRDRQGGAQ